jgi:hypothetical protein
VEGVGVTFVLSIICDHSRQGLPEPRPDRVVTRLAYFPRPEGRFGWLEWRELVLEDDPTYPPALQTYFGEARRLGRSSAEFGSDNLVPGMTEGQRWRFWCADCDDTLPARHTKLVTYLDGLRLAGRTSVTLAGLAPRL